MEINVIQHDGYAQLVVTGRIDSSTAPQFEGALIAQLDGAATSTLVDMTAVDFVSSAGLRVFLMGAKKVKGTAAEMILCAMNENIRNVFKMSGFDRILSIADSLEDGVGQVSN
ncbi:STAS domain-containing protein [uncultured Ruegeria sp.]|uniref:STAS domain-containing protein n=1 Tax=uncultured Ruegeria sp. TaxID=259304 RepID=UPI00261BF701|nr:STAS domain-containing protein [uncultured Ruegeria sp.]